MLINVYIACYNFEYLVDLYYHIKRKLRLQLSVFCCLCLSAQNTGALNPPSLRLMLSLKQNKYLLSLAWTGSLATKALPSFKLSGHVFL